MITNGTLIDERVARALVEMRWDLTRVSVHAGDADTYQRVQGVDHFERLRDRLKQFDRIRREAHAEDHCKVHIHNVLQKVNVSSIPHMFEFAEEVGADAVVFELVFPPGDVLNAEELDRVAEALDVASKASPLETNLGGFFEELKKERLSAPSPTPQKTESQPEPEELVLHEQVQDLEATAETSQDPEESGEPIELTPPYRPANRCSVGFDSAFVTSLGDVLPCCFSDEVMGNLRDQSFRQIWYGPKYRDFRERLINGQFAGYCSRFRCKLTSFLHD